MKITANHVLHHGVSNVYSVFFFHLLEIGGAFEASPVGIVRWDYATGFARCAQLIGESTAGPVGGTPCPPICGTAEGGNGCVHNDSRPGLAAGARD